MWFTGPPAAGNSTWNWQPLERDSRGTNPEKAALLKVPLTESWHLALTIEVSAGLLGIACATSARGHWTVFRTRSHPAPPFRISFPLLPVIWLLPASPVILSSKPEPIMFSISTNVLLILSVAAPEISVNVMPLASVE